MDLYAELNRIILSYGLQPIYKKGEFEKEVDELIDEETGNYDERTENIFFMDTFYILFRGPDDERVGVRDINLFAEKMRKQNGWSLADKLLIENMDVVYSVFNEEYLIEVKNISQKLKKMNVKSPEVEAFMRKNMREEQVEKNKLKAIFEPEEILIELKPYLLEGWKTITSILKGNVGFTELKRELSIVLRGIYQQKIASESSNREKE